MVNSPPKSVIQVRAASLKQVRIDSLWNEASEDSELHVHLNDNGSWKDASLENVKIPVITFNTQTRKMEGGTAVSVIKRKKILWNIRTKNLSIRASAEHKHWAKFKDNQDWTPTSSLTPDHKLLNLQTGSWENVNDLGIEFEREEFAYDLEVPPYHSYVANGTVTHNSHMVIQLAKTQGHMGYKVVVVPLEMTEHESYARLLSNVGKMDSLRINLKKLAQEEKDLLWKRYRRFQRQVEENGGRFSLYRPKEDVTIEETLAAVHSFNPDVVYVDYIGLLKGADSEDQWRKLGQIARYGKVYAGNTNKVVVLAAQVNEDGKIRYSGAVKEHSSLAFSFVATKESREKGYLNMEMLKGRNQQLMNFTLAVNYATSELKDLDPAQAEEMENQDVTGASKKKKGEDSAEDYLPNLDD